MDGSDGRGTDLILWIKIAIYGITMEVDYRRRGWGK